MRINFFIVLILFFSVFSTASDFFPRNDDREGARTVYIAREDEFSLTVMLRQCFCEQKKIMDQRFPQLCECFNNRYYEDQPFIQGNFYNALALFTLSQICFTGFGFGQDEKTRQFFILIPRPERLLEILQKLKLDCIELVPGGGTLSIDEYFGLLNEKKIPIAKIPRPDEVKDISMRYHAYFHDLLNHFFFWIALPSSIKEVIAQRASMFIERFGKLKQQFLAEDAKDCAYFIDLLSLVAVANFDISMGNSNIHMLSPPSPFSTEKIDDRRKDHYLRFIDFGLGFKKDKTFQPNTFFQLWLVIHGRRLEKEFIKLSEKEIEEKYFDYIKVIKKDSAALLAFEYIKSQARQENHIFPRILEKYKEIYGTLIDPQDEIPIPSIKECYEEIISFYENIFRGIKNNEQI